MTIKEFSEKYGIKYSIVYNASYYVRLSSTMDYRNRQFDEKELMEAVRTLVLNRYSIYRDKAEKYGKLMLDLNGYLTKL